MISINFFRILLFISSFTRTNATQKRPSTGSKPKAKRLRVQATQLIHQNQPKLSSKPVTVQSVFEQAVGKPQQSTNKIGQKLAETISAIFDAAPSRLSLEDEQKKG